MDGWMDTWMKMDRWIDGYICIDGWVDGQMNGWTDEWIDR